MKYSAIGRESGTPDWPTACPGCGEAKLAYQYEYGMYDCYRCTACGQHALCRDEQRPDGSWCRRLTMAPSDVHGVDVTALIRLLDSADSFYEIERILSGLIRPLARYMDNEGYSAVDNALHRAYLRVRAADPKVKNE